MDQCLHASSYIDQSQCGTRTETTDRTDHHPDRPKWKQEKMLNEKIKLAVHQTAYQTKVPMVQKIIRDVKFCIGDKEY